MAMHKTLIVILVLFSTLHAKNIRPIASIKVSGLVSDFVKDGDYLYVATDAGSVDIIDLFTREIVEQIRVGTP